MKKNVVSKSLTLTLAHLLLIISTFAQHTDPPEFTVSCPKEALTAGEIVDVSVTTKNKYWAEKLSTLTYNWTVSNGTIKEGQGTPKIKIKTPADATSITATVRIESDQHISYKEAGDSCTFNLITLPVAAKVDELIGRANCEDILARLDTYFVSLQNDPGAAGLIAIYDKKSSKSDVNANSIRSPMFQTLTWMGTRGFNASRINIIRVPDSENAKTEFWLIPAGATPPEINGVSWSYDLPSQTKAFLLGTEFSDGIGGCDPGNPYLYAEFLKANPEMRGNVVIHAVTPANYHSSAKAILKDLAEKGVARGRLKTFFVKVKPKGPPEFWFSLESTEYWLVPARR